MRDIARAKWSSMAIDINDDIINLCGPAWCTREIIIHKICSIRLIEVGIVKLLSLRAEAADFCKWAGRSVFASGSGARNVLVNFLPLISYNQGLLCRPGCAWLFFTRGNKLGWERRSEKAVAWLRALQREMQRRRRVVWPTYNNKSTGALLSICSFVTPLIDLRCAHHVTVNQSRQEFFSFHGFLRHERTDHVANEDINEYETEKRSESNRKMRYNLHLQGKAIWVDHAICHQYSLYQISIILEQYKRYSRTL